MESPRVNVGIMGGSGYVGGELLRLLVQHPSVHVTAVSSQSYKGKAIARVHPNLRGVPLDKFIHPDELPSLTAGLAAGQQARSEALVKSLREDPALLALLDFESDETFILDIQNVGASAADGTTEITHTHTITNDDAVNNIIISITIIYMCIFGLRKLKNGH